MIVADSGRTGTSPGTVPVAAYIRFESFFSRVREKVHREELQMARWRPAEDERWVLDPLILLTEFGGEHIKELIVARAKEGDSAEDIGREVAFLWTSVWRRLLSRKRRTVGDALRDGD
jgi:hypothetical protein